jgi:hypothetical protein
MNIRLFLNVILIISLPTTIIAGLLIVSQNIKIKLLGANLYYITNGCLIASYFITHAEMYLINALIFGTLTTINVVRIWKQLKDLR